MYSDNPPPKEKVKGDFPSFAQHAVTVEQCWYYLSLLERFVDITKNMSENDLKLYLVRAEYRYFRFISKKTGDRKIVNSTPPLGMYGAPTVYVLLFSLSIEFRHCLFLAGAYAESCTLL